MSGRWWLQLQKMILHQMQILHSRRQSQTWGRCWQSRRKWILHRMVILIPWQVLHQTRKMIQKLVKIQMLVLTQTLLLPRILQSQL